MNLECDIEPYYEARMVLVSGTTEIRRMIKSPATSPKQALERMESALRVIWPDAAIHIEEPKEIAR